MTDAEINLAIAKIEYPDKEVGSLDNGSAFIVYHPRSGVKNYIKYWGDIGPIIEREGISVLTDTSNLWAAYSEVIEDAAGDYWHKNLQKADKPTRAACLCYLKTKGVE